MRGVLLVALCPLLASAPAGADGTERPADTVGVHVVTAGETLEKITEKYLGDRGIWRENWALNPQVKDPDVLSVGQRLRVITRRTPPLRSAEVTRAERRVDAKTDVLPWTPARVGDRLRERDGLRTLQKSSAALAFDDGSNIVLTEDSVVFLKEVSTSARGVKRDAIEIREGQADLSAHPMKTRSPEIEIIIGEATARPRPEEKSPSRTRARRVAAGGAEVMVYGGTNDVEAGGARVTVKRGQGTKVPEKGPPLPPENLLPAPALLAPARAAEIRFGNPRFSWTAVPGAASYSVEVCRDAACAVLVERAVGLKTAIWSAEGLPAGVYHWRATATGPSGLDGFPAEAVPFALLSVEVDREPPVVVAQAVGPARFTGEDAVMLARGGRIRLEGLDDVSGIAEVRYRWDSGAWAIAPGASVEPVEPPSSPGAHVLEFSAIDRTGRTSPVRRVRVEVAPEAAEPPRPSVFPR